MVIHRLARHFILRRGKALIGCVTNKGFIGSGERLDSRAPYPPKCTARRGRSAHELLAA